MPHDRNLARTVFAAAALALGASLAAAHLPAHAAPTAEELKARVKWTCPMHPHYIADDKGACPICGMDLVALDTGDGTAGTAGGPARAAITIAPETLQTMGVRIAKAERTTFGRIIRSYGLVEDNQRLQTELSARLEGWIEDLRIRAVGDEVKAGDLLFTLFAPEFVVSQRDFLTALREGNRPRMESIKTRLRAFGMQDRAIAELQRRGEVLELVPFYADRDGTVAMIDLRPGSYVDRGTMLTRIQDYSQVWLMVGVPEKDLTFIRPSTPARVTFPNIPGREVFAKVEYVYPTVDPRTRTGKVRLVLDNPDGQLRPGAYADVAFEVDAEQRLAVPSEAILEGGGERYVVVSLGNGRFEPRVVRTGLTAGRWSEIAGEIVEGQDIVVSGQFLIDSESALRESFRKLERLQLPLSLIELDANQLAMLDHMVDAALYVHESIVDGYDLDPKMLEPAIEVKTLLWPAFQHTRLAFVMEDAARALEKAKATRSHSELREALAAIVSALGPWLREGAPAHYEKKRLAMLREAATGRQWLQLDGKPLNPYGEGEAERMPWPDQPAHDAPAAAGRTSAGDAVTPPPPAHRH